MPIEYNPFPNFIINFDIVHDQKPARGELAELSVPKGHISRVGWSAYLTSYMRMSRFVQASSDSEAGYETLYNY